MISFRQKGDFSKTARYLDKVKTAVDLKILDKYGRAGVAALSSATPIDSGVTASSWTYKIVRTDSTIELIFDNTNVVDHVNIAVILQYGHGTRNGGWVQGRDYINPAIQPIFNQLAEEAWREVTKL